MYFYAEESGTPAPYMGAHWHHLANTIEPSVCGGDAVLCQITLTTCSYHSCYQEPGLALILILHCSERNLWGQLS